MRKNKTTEEFKQEIYDLVGDEYEVLSEYINTTTYIDVKHNKCGCIYSVKPYSFLRGSRCLKCSGKAKRTTEEFKQEVYDLVGDEYEVLGNYTNANTPIEMRHNVCGHIYKVNPNNFLRGRRCPDCFTKKKKTIEEFKKEVYDLVGNEYEVVGEYINTDTNIEIKHKVCGHTFQVMPKHFLYKNSRCPICLNRNRMTFEEFKIKLYETVGDEYKIIGDYIDSSIPVEIKHIKCNHVFKIKPKSFLNGNRCPNCVNKENKTIKDLKKEKNATEKFKKEVYNLVYNKYEILSDYIDDDTPIKIKHNKCNYIYEVKPYIFLKGGRCPKCAGKSQKTTEKFKKEIYDLIGDEYVVLEDYINSRVPIKIKHTKCNYIYEVKPSSFLGGSRCPKCAGKTKKTTKEFKKEVYDLVGDEYIVLGKYINNKTHIKMRHNKCGHVYVVKPYQFLDNKRCPRCNSSKGELSIARFLDKYNINYKHDKSYGNCSYKGALRFDFLIFDSDNNLKLICEFDGIQHFEPAKSFGGEEKFKEIQIRDGIKNNFCKENNIPLIRIPYWDIDNIDKILSEKLYKLELIKSN